MDAKALLESLLQTSKEAAKKGSTLAEEKMGVPDSGPERDAALSNMKKGALAAGAVALLLGTKGGRKLTGTAVTVGGLAAVGGLAYKTYNDWQAKQSGGAGTHTGTPVGELDEPAANERSLLLVRAMISAARADGHIDAAERASILEKITRLGVDQETTDFLIAEIDRPLDPQLLASDVMSQEEAAEVYVISAMVVDSTQREERRYLDRLAGALKLPTDLTDQLDAGLKVPG